MTISVSLQLDDRHATALGQLCNDQDLSKAALLRQALRLYQLVHLRAKEGQQMAFVKDGVVVPTVVVGLPAFD